MAASLSVSRRAFLVRGAAISGSLMVGVCFPHTALGKKNQKTAAASVAPEVTAWVIVNPETLFCFVSRVRKWGRGALLACRC